MELSQINSMINSGSICRIAEEIGQIAMKNDWKSYIAYGRNDRPSQLELIKIGSDLDIRMHGLQTRLFDRHGLASIAATMEFVEQIKKIKPDIIHLHNIHVLLHQYRNTFSILKGRKYSCCMDFL